ncbi:MAG: 8-oxo-dGTP pyrophosphatase MutT (NUDIX family) [Myxococcota bacterium]|jgi:8-oxo-dGTP pyrophosphatase MutT (NUDIX family)
MPEARPAATIMVLRDGEDGLELLMLRRSSKASFFPHAWVFPGGRVDPADAEVAVRGAIDGVPASEHRYAVAAIRECFEEAGAWLGDGEPSGGLRDALNARQATLLDAPGLIADLERLELWSWWVTPDSEPKRYDTRFFITALRPDEVPEISHDEIETVSSQWMRPVDALAADDFFLAPPTFLTLRELSAFDTAAEAMAAAAIQPVAPIMPTHGHNEDGSFVIALPGDPLHPDPVKCCEYARVVLREGRWIGEG